MATCVRGVGGRHGQRIRHDRRHHHLRAPGECGRKRGLRATEAIGRSKSGLSTKLHALTDAPGNPVAFHLTPGHLHDLHGADALIPHLTGRFAALLADRAYDAHDRVIRPLLDAGIAPVIPSRINRTWRRKHDPHLFRARHLVENFFAKLKAYRAIGTRYDKRAAAFMGAVYLASTITLN